MQKASTNHDNKESFDLPALPDDYYEIKAEVFRVIRVNADEKSAKKVLNRIKEHLPEVAPEVLKQCINELCTTCQN